MKKNILENAGHGSLGHRIFCILRDKILNEEYEKGQKLNEVVLSKELNISRTPIREALKQLELEGLVKSIPNKGVYVLGFSSRDIDDMLEIRVVLESLSIQLAIDRITQEELDRIKEIYDAIVKKDKALAKANVEKHIRKTQSLVRNYYDEKDETQE